MNETPRNAFEKAAEEPQSQTLLGEFLSFLAHNKKWWMLPIVIVLMLLAVLIMLAGTAATPWIYTLF